MTTQTASVPTRDVAEPRAEPRRLGTLGKALAGRIERLQADYLRGAPAARADLAQLRRGLGKPAGSVPDIWEMTVGSVPDELTWHRDEPSRAEQAAHAAFTLYALHQQSLAVPAHVPGVSFGRAAGRLRLSENRSDEAVTRRFMAVATAESIDEVLTHVRGLITQLRGERQGIDYARFADDIFGLLLPGRAQRVRLAWGRAFYRTRPESGSVPGAVAAESDESTANDE